MIADAAKLKEKVVQDFEKWLYRLSYGHMDEYCHIINSISLIEAWNHIDNIYPIYEKLIINGTT